MTFKFKNGSASILLFLALLSSSSTLYPSAAQAEDAPPPPRTKTDTNREVVRTYAQIYLEAKNFEQAEKSLAQYLSTEDKDPTLWNLMGISQLAQKKFAQGCYGFKKASELFPPGEDQANALYGFADCLNQGNKSDDAMRVLKAMIERGGSGAVSAENALDKIKKKEINSGQPLPPFVWKQRGKLRVSTALTTGYDTNVLLIDDITANTSAVLGQGSVFLTPALQIGYWGNLFNLRYDTRLQTSFTDYLGESAKSYNLLYERLDFLIGPSDMRFGLVQEMAFINRTPFQLFFLNAGVVAQKKNRRSKVEEIGFEIPIKYKYFYADKTALAENVRNGVSLGGKIQYLRIYDEDIRFFSQFALTNDYTSGRNFRLVSLSWPTSVLLPLPGFKSLGLVNSFGVELAGEYYFQSDVSRRDWSFKLNGGLVKDFWKSFHALLDYSYQKNYSNVEAARYKKHTVTLNLSYDLL